MTESSPAANLELPRPAPLDSRYLSLDAVRGFAVMGILVMNIAAFAMPTAAYFSPANQLSASNADWMAWGVNFLLFDSTMRGLFSILFGASTLLVIERTRAMGENSAINHYTRMFWLLVFGLAHFYLIWFGDILTLYALCGLLLYLFRNASIRSLIIWAILFGLVHLLLYSLLVGILLAAQGGAMPEAGMAETLTQFQQDFGFSEAQIAADLALYRGGYAQITDFRTGVLGWAPAINFFAQGWTTLSLMLVGMVLLKNGFLTGDWDLARYRKWAVVLFVSMVSATALLLWVQLASGSNPVMIFATAIVWNMPFDLLLSVGWAALLIWWIKRAADSEIVRRVAATGRAAFTNYLGTSILMTTIFYGYGLGLFGSVDRWALWLFVLGGWAIMLLWSKPWLDRYRYGPLEWLWRSLARGRLQPMRKASVAA